MHLMYMHPLFLNEDYKRAVASAQLRMTTIKSSEEIEEVRFGYVLEILVEG
jgi:hypothetical protein